MDDRARLESTVEELRLAVLALEKRLDALEQRSLAAAGPGGGAVPGAATATTTAAPRLSLRDQRDPIFVLSLIGRLFLVLAGGFFLRAMTEADVLAPPVGVSLAFAYGLVWLFMADRAARGQQWLSAVFHAGGAALVAFPLLVEATLRFKVLNGTASAVVLALLTAGFLLLSWRQRLHPIAWIAVVGALPTSAFLLVQTGVVAPFALYLIAFGIVTLWLGHTLNWPAIPWLVALAADVAVVGVTLRAAGPETRDPLAVALLLQMLLLGAYMFSFAFRSLARGRSVTLFEIVQTVPALAIGFGGAVYLTRGIGSVAALFGIASLAFGAACYALAVIRLDKLEGSGRNVYYYTTLALVLVLSGCTLVLGRAGLGVAFAALAVLATASWSRAARPYMLFHGAVYVVAAGIASGTLGYSATELLGIPSAPWVMPGVVMLIVLAASAASAWFAAGVSGSDDSAFVKGLRLCIILVSVWVASGCVIGFLGPLTGVLHDRTVDVGALATVRTGVLAVGALLVAWFGRHVRFREWGWIVYPLLIGIGLKMIAQDFKHSRPATLFIALALYGAALIIAPRLRRGTAKPAAQPAGE